MFKLFSMALVSLSLLQAAQSEVLHHELEVKINPNIHNIQVKDKLIFQDCSQDKSLKLILHQGLAPQVKTKNVKLKFVQTITNSIAKDIFLLSLPKGTCEIEISYGGPIFHPPKGELAPGSIQPEGVSLFGGTYWYPQFEDEFLVSIDLKVESPRDWHVVSQGSLLNEKLVGNNWQFHWQELQPQDGLYLLAGRFSRTITVRNGITSYVYLRSEDAELASSYHELTHDNISMYSSKLGAYPYQKFATVENFWETGFGLPSSTLLGPSVIRLPFLAYSSFPHEILHNWWGNSVYVDYSEGNWCEGLTSYMADHYFQELRGGDSNYRRSALQKFSSHVNASNDFPLKDFIGRYNDSSSAIGYGKSLYFFHMLKNLIGKSNFEKGLKLFYKTNKFKAASYPELMKAFEQVSSRSLSLFFNQWVNKKGIPMVAIKNAQQKNINGRHGVSIKLQQNSSDVFDLEVPYELTHTDGTQGKGWHSMKSADSQIELEFNKKVKTVSIDPKFDVFRKPHVEEVPKVLTNIIGDLDSEQTVVLPAGSAKLYEVFFKSWNKQKANKFNIITDKNKNIFPASKVVWVVGWDNGFLGKVKKQATKFGVTLASDSIQIKGQAQLGAKENSILLVLHDKVKDQFVVWLGVNSQTDLKTLARKLVHYGKYSYLGFNKSSKNILKGQWSAVGSPLIHNFK